MAHWEYDGPDMVPDKDGRRKLIVQRCWGPLQVHEWGIDPNGKPYKEYNWIENDFFADENYHKEISWEELISAIDDMIDCYRKEESIPMAVLYEKVRNELLQLAQK